ncbi:MAG: DUF362 domain-containing protein [Candidatus Sungbacteria bacterium]|nr:DUF362 domain-containing protein [Candidatus Sungbacteria bacterium]
MTTQPNNILEVALVTGNDRRSMVREALTLLGDAVQKSIAEAHKIFIHPNLVNYRNQGACTPVEAVRGVLDHISLIRNDIIKIGDAGFHDTKKAFDAFGYASLDRSGNIELVDLNDDEAIPVATYDAAVQKSRMHQAASGVLGGMGFSKTIADTDCNIVVVPAKMHSYYIATLAIKTHIVGSLIVKRSPFGIHARWPWLHTGYKPAHMSLAELYCEYPARLTVIDGTQAMEGDGPASGTTVNLGWVIASLNPVAADGLAAYLMGWEPEDIGYLYYLEQKNLGPIHVRDMRILGSDPNMLRRELQRPSTYPEILQWR